MWNTYVLMQDQYKCTVNQHEGEEKREEKEVSVEEGNGNNKQTKEQTKQP
jgi:hypothetical protein